MYVFMYVSMYVCNEFTIEICGFTHSLCMFLAHAAHEDRRRHQARGRVQRYES